MGDGLRDRFRPLLSGRVQDWQGLQVGTAREALLAAFGEPVTETEVQLGWYPAHRLKFSGTADLPPFRAYERDGLLVMIEAEVMPPATVLERLGEPCARLPAEIVHEEGYVHEFLYCDRGLVLGVMEPFAENAPWRIVRSRGIQPLHDASGFDARYYRAFQDDTVW